MKYPLLAALTAITALIALTSITLAPAFTQTASGAATGQNGAQYGDPNNSMAEGSQTTNGALSGQNPGSTSPGDITSGSDETHPIVALTSTRTITAPSARSAMAS